MTKASVADLVLDEFLPYRLSIASNAVSKLIASAYAREFDLTVPEWRLIAVLHQDRHASQQELVRRTMMDKVTVSRAARALEDAGLIRRESNEEDGRAVSVALTRAGQALFSSIEPAALGYERRVLAGFTKAEIRQLHEMLSRIIDTALAADQLE
jgi:DNA-binding MarR family transcriptional regulator